MQIENRGMKGSDYRIAWDVMNGFAISLGKETMYLKDPELADK